MPNFTFRFQALLGYRKNRRDLCRQLLAELLADDTKLDRDRQKLEQNRAEQLQQLRELGERGSVDVDRLAARRYYAGQLVRDIHSIDHNRTLLSQQLDLCRQALTKADQDVKVLEKIAEKQLAEFQYEQQRKSERELNETWLAARVGEYAK